MTTIQLGPGLMYKSGLVSEVRLVPRDGTFGNLTAHAAATVEQHLLATQLEWLQRQLDTCGDGLQARPISEAGRPWVLMRGSTRLAGRVVWCAVLVDASECHVCPLRTAGSYWLRQLLRDRPEQRREAR